MTDESTDIGEHPNRDGPPPEDQRNTGWKFDLLDADRAEEDEWDMLAQMGNYDTRHEAIGMAAKLQIWFPDKDLDYEVRAHETMWEECEEPTTCDWHLCDTEEWYLPITGWYFPTGYGPDDDPYGTENSGGALCSEECFRRWEWHHHPERFREMAEKGERDWTRTRMPKTEEVRERERKEAENHDIGDFA